MSEEKIPAAHAGSGAQRRSTGSGSRQGKAEAHTGQAQASGLSVRWQRMQRQARVTWKGISRQPHIAVVPLVFGAVCLALGLWGVYFASQNDAEKARFIAQSHVDSAANSLQNSFAAGLLPLVQLASTIKYTKDFNQMMEMWPVRAPDWWSSVPKGVQTLRMNAFGKVAQVYPMTNQTAYLTGVDVLEGARRADSLKVIANRQPVASGPLILNGVYSVLVRIPIFVPNVSRDEQFNIPWTMNDTYCPPDICYVEATRSKWWGFAVLGMDWQEFLESHGDPLQHLEAAGLNFHIDRPPNEFATPPEEGRQLVQNSGSAPADHALVASIDILGATWTLYVWSHEWNPSYMVPMMVVVVVVSVVCTIMLFLVLLTRAEHEALLRSLLPESAITKALEAWTWSNELDNDALTMLLQGTPAEAIMSIVADLLLGKVPPLPTVAAVRSALEAGVDIYQPLRADLSNRMEANELMDSEVKAALMAQLLGRTAALVSTVPEVAGQEQEEEVAVAAGSAEEGGRKKGRQSLSGVPGIKAASSASGQAHQAAPDGKQPEDTVLIKPALLIPDSPWRRTSQRSVQEEEEGPYSCIESALIAITGIEAEHAEGIAVHNGRMPCSRASAPTDVVRMPALSGPAPRHQRCSAHAWIGPGDQREGGKRKEGGDSASGGASSRSSDGRDKAPATPLQGLQNARASLTALLKQRSSATPSIVTAPSNGSSSHGTAVLMPPAPGAAELQIVMAAETAETDCALPTASLSTGGLTHNVLAGMREKQVLMIDDPGRPIYTKLEAILHTSNQWTFNSFTLEDAACGRPLSALGFWLFHWSGLIDQCRLNRAKLARFLMAVEDGYLDNPYHNRRHAADVLRTLHVLLTRGGLAPGYADNDTMVACYLAAIVHDFEHLGVNNDYLCNSQHDLALRYNDRCPMENHHLAAAWTLLRNPEYNFLENMGKSHWNALRKLVVDLVLSTDMKQHFAVMGQFSALHRLAISDDSNDPPRSSQSFDTGGSLCTSIEGDTAGTFAKFSTRMSPVAAHDARRGEAHTKPTAPVAPILMPISDGDQLLSLQVAMKLADLGHMATPQHVHRKWVRGLEQEFFLQGDKERSQGLPCSPLCDRTKQGVTKSQIGFFEYVVIPLFNNYVHRFTAARPLHKAMMHNYRHWQAEAKAHSMEHSSTTTQ